MKARISALAGARATAFHDVAGGHTLAGRARVQFDDGRTLFAKWGTSEDTSRWLREEWRIYGAVEAEYLARVEGWEDDGESPLLLLEDLASAYWAPPWRPGDLGRVVDTLHRVACTRAPPQVPSADIYRDTFCGWQRIAEDPEPLLKSGAVQQAWLDASLPGLVERERSVQLDGGDLIHLDARADNLCFKGDQPILFDWNWACRGRRSLDIGYFLASSAAHVDALLPDDEGAFVLIAGHQASQFPKPPPPGTTGLRELQRRVFDRVLPWLIEREDLPPCDSAV